MIAPLFPDNRCKHTASRQTRTAPPSAVPNAARHLPTLRYPHVKPSENLKLNHRHTETTNRRVEIYQERPNSLASRRSEAVQQKLPRPERDASERFARANVSDRRIAGGSVGLPMKGVPRQCCSHLAIMVLFWFWAGGCVRLPTGHWRRRDCGCLRQHNFQLLEGKKKD